MALQANGAALSALSGVEVSVSACVGSAAVALATAMSFAEGAIVPLDCAHDALATLLVNGVAVATGELVETEDGMLAFEIKAIVS
jgi:flagellar motor switch protein FliN/FliY